MATHLFTRLVWHDRVWDDLAARGVILPETAQIFRNERGDPADVHGPDFPGETFRVLKEKETAKFGEYRTRRLVLEAWDRLPPREP